MRIFIVPSWYPNELNSIRGVFFKEQARSLVKSGIEVVILYPEIRSLKNFGKYNSQGVVSSIEDGILTYRYNTYNYFPKFSIYSYLMSRYALKKLYNQAVKENGKPDLLHAHSTIWGGIAASFIAQNKELPLIITEHSSAFGRYKLSDFKKKSVKNAISKSEELIVVSNMLKTEMKKYSSIKEIKVIPNVVDTNEFTIEESELPNNKFRFFSAGFLNHNKGMDILIEAFTVFKEKKVELVIAGDGVEFNNLNKLTDALGINNQVTFLGRISRNEIKNQMQKCDAFVLSSRYETFGVVYAEALACGKPIIATNCGGPEMIVNEKNGFLVPKESVNDLSKAMIKMIDNIDIFDPKTIRTDCIEKYSEEVVVNQLQQVYNDVIDKHNSLY